MIKERRFILSKMLNVFSSFSLEQDKEGGAVAVKLFSKYGDTLRMNIPNTSKYQKKIEVFLVLFGFFPKHSENSIQSFNIHSTNQKPNRAHLI